MAGIRAAATVILCKASPTRSSPQILFVKRRATARFFPGYYVFPGGLIEKSDAVTSSSQSGQTSDRISSRGVGKRRCRPGGEVVGEECSVSGDLISVNEAFDEAQQEVRGELTGAAVERQLSIDAFKVGAVREVFEETGILLATEPYSVVNKRLTMKAAYGLDSSPGDKLGGNAVESYRKKVQKDAELFGEMCEKSVCAPDTAALYPWDWWLTPREEKSKWRYNTLFFVGVLREGDDRGLAQWDEHETDGFVWLTAQEALDGFRQGLVKLAPPTWLAVHRLAAFDTIDSLEQHLRTLRFEVPHCPVFVPGGDPEEENADSNLLFVSYLQGDEKNSYSPGVLGSRNRIYGSLFEERMQYRLNKSNKQLAPPVSKL